MHKLEDWKRQLEQAEEQGLFFDRYTVKEMIEAMEKQKKEIVDLKMQLSNCKFDLANARY